jgi:choline-sulfatase
MTVHRMIPAALCVGILMAAIPAFVYSAGPPPRRPNVLFVYTDDQALWTIGAYGNREVKTPSFDRLAREGAIFRNAFTVTPVCSPSRASMMTGRHPTSLGIDDWINPNTEPDLGLSPSALLWPEVLRGAGYHSMLLGKWHLGTRDEFHPTRQGYDRFFGFRDGGNKPIDPRLEVEGTVKQLKGSLPDLLVDEGLKFLESNRDRPFLLSVHFREPHAPYAPVPEVDSAVYRDIDPAAPDVKGLPARRVKQLRREYYASVHAVDRNLGRLLDSIDRLELAKETIVIVLSDHGYMIGQHGLWHKGNATWLVEGKSGPRPNLFDDAIRVPLIVRWPGTVKPGSAVEKVVTNLDIFPSVLEMTGVGIPPNLAVDGRSFVPLLKQDPAAASTWDDTMIGQYDMHHTKTARMRMIRTPEWKLIRHFEPDTPDEMYHLEADPGETVDLIDAPEHREQLAALKAELHRRLVAIQDPIAARAKP